MAWVSFTAAALVLLNRFADPGLIWRDVTGSALLDLCGVLTMCGIVYCLWIQYGVSAEHRILLTMIAFSGLALSSIAHAACTVLGRHLGYFHTIGLLFDSGWKIGAAGLLLAAAGSTAPDSREDCRKLGLRRLLEALGLSLGLAGLSFQAMRLAPHVDPDLLAMFTSLGHTAAAWAYSPLVAPVITLILLLFAFGATMRRPDINEDRLSSSMAAFLLIAVSAGMACAASVYQFTPAWWLAQTLELCGLLVLLVRLGAEFGASYAESHARIEHLEAVHYISSRLSQSLDLRVILLALVSDTAKMLSARFASIMLADDVGDNLRTITSYGLPDSPIGLRKPQPIEGSGRPGFFAGHTARSFREKRVCVVDDVYTDVEFIPWRQLSQHDGYSISLPLIYHEVALGVLNLFFDKHVTLNDERVKLLQTLASAAAVAIANAQLYDHRMDAEGDGIDIQLPMAS